MSKKSFIDDVAKDYNPAEAFISTSTTTAPADTKPIIKDREAVEAELQAERERKANVLSERMQILLSKQQVKDLKDLSRFDGRSVNNIINTVIADYIKARQDDLNKIRSL